MTARKGIAATVMLAALAVPALSACGDDRADQAAASSSAAASTSAAATAAARDQMRRAHEDFKRCLPTETGRYASDLCETQVSVDGGYTFDCGRGSSASTPDPERIESCAADMIEAAKSGTPIPAAPPASTTNTTAAPAPQASSSSSGIGSALVGFVQLALGAACVLGLPALVIWGAIAGRRRARAVHRQGAEWQQPAPSAPAPQMYDASRDHDAFDEPHDTPNNPWA